jgi:hypothetical protein
MANRNALQLFNAMTHQAAERFQIAAFAKS